MTADRVAELEAEVSRLRATNTRLNRRVTKAEGQVATTIEECRRQGVSLGRGLANAGYESMRAKHDEVSAELDAARADHARIVAGVRALGNRWAEYAEWCEQGGEGTGGAHTPRMQWKVAARQLLALLPDDEGGAS